MAANIVTFDSDYIRERAKTVAAAKKLLDDACACLKKANRHEGWGCPERLQINDSLHDVSSRLERLSVGLEASSSALTKGAGQFAELESQALKEENTMSEQLKENWGFKALKWIKDTLNKAKDILLNPIGKVHAAESTNLPVTQVPPLPSSQKSAKFDLGEFVGDVWEGFSKKWKDFWAEQEQKRLEQEQEKLWAELAKRQKELNISNASSGSSGTSDSKKNGGGVNLNDIHPKIGNTEVPRSPKWFENWFNDMFSFKK
jgi:hypothetical protein